MKNYKKFLRIDSEKYYSLQEVFKMKVIPWVDSFITLRKLVERDIDHGNVLFRSIVIGNNFAKRYKIKGEHLIGLLKRIQREGLILNGD